MISSGFPRNYEVRQLTALSDLPTGLPCFRLEYDECQTIERDLTDKDLHAFSLMVMPSGARHWVGLFWGDIGSTERDQWITCPDPNAMLVLTRLECFYGNASDPSSFVLLPTKGWATQDVLVFEEHNLILVTADQQMVAIDKNGPAWFTDGIVPDSVFVTGINKGLIYGHGDDGRHEFQIDLVTGEIKKGGLSPNETIRRFK